MKLAWIGESFILSKIRDAMSSSNYFNRPFVQTDQPYEATSGHSNLPEKMAPTQSTGVPAKPRQRRYLGMELRPGTIRL